jgi:cap1 methyltransferase
LPSNFKTQKHEKDTSEYSYEQTINYINCKNPISDTRNIYKSTISNEGENLLSGYCDKNLVNELMTCKTEFDKLDHKIFIDARFRVNPYERLGRSLFQNRAALKMANMDKIAKITEIEKVSEEVIFQIIIEKCKFFLIFLVLYFADICAGPGGFTGK